MLNIQDLSSGIRMIGLDRADKRNAIGVELTLALEQVLLDTRYRDDIRALVFHGIGGHFCAGMDLKDFFDSSTRPPEELRRARAATEHWRCHLLRQMPQRIFTAVEGYCLGGALPILQCSHHVTAHVDARLGMPEINFGFVPGGQIVKSVGLMATHRALSYLALTGRLINAERARQWGLVGTVVEHNPLDHALQLAHDWVTNPAMPQ
ncbi:MAG: enoyl-CoA hydratase/isomerase family protein [Limnohabitans sp.]|jgi:enoyl-CoA hydratase/carnithine racemase|nr:enoyl-CoA hydratase/isomerase family protein [Burkholderiaceae bacterium]